MSRVRPLAWLAVAAAVAAGCATGGGGTATGEPGVFATRSGQGTHARCLADSGRSGADRPLFFLFCVQGP